MYDLLVIGGGVIGLSISYEIAGRGKSVAVVDRGRGGSDRTRASWAGAGILPPAEMCTAENPWDQLVGLSHQLHPVWSRQLQTETGIDNGYRRSGGVYLARQAGDAALLRAAMSDWRAVGVQVEELSMDDLARCERGLGCVCERGDIKAAFFLPDEAQLRNPWHLRALRAGCERRGVRLIDQQEVAAWRESAGRLAAVHTSDGPLAADAFCLAGGAWSSRLAESIMSPPQVFPLRGQMVLFRLPEPPLQRIVNEGPRYLVPREDGRVLAGSTVEEAGFDLRVTEEGRRELVSFAHSLVPELAPDRVEDAWAGLRPATLDGLPYLGRAAGFDNLYVATGHYRSGLHLSPGTAVVMADLICGEPPRIDLAPFALDR